MLHPLGGGGFPLESRDGAPRHRLPKVRPRSWRSAGLTACVRDDRMWAAPYAIARLVRGKGIYREGFIAAPLISANSLLPFTSGDSLRLSGRAATGKPLQA